MVLPHTVSPRHRSVHREQGFGLVEIIVAAILIAIVSTALAAAVVNSSSTDVRARTSLQMQAAADALAEKARDDQSWMKACSIPVADAQGDCTQKLNDAISDADKDEVLRRYYDAGDSGKQYGAVLDATFGATGYDSKADGVGASDSDQIRPDYFRITVNVTAKYPPGHPNAGQVIQEGLSEVQGGTVVSPWRAPALGGVIVQVCKVEGQTDERASIGACDAGRTQPIAGRTGSTCGTGTAWDLAAWCAAPASARQFTVAPVANTTVRLTRGATTVATATTDAQGLAVFDQLTPGKYNTTVGATNATTQLWPEKSSPGGAAQCNDTMDIAIMKGQQASAVAVLKPRMSEVGCPSTAPNVPVRLASSPAVADNPFDASSYASDGGYWLRLSAAPAGRERVERATELKARGIDPAEGGWSWVCNRTRNYDNWLFLPYCAAHPTETHIHDDMHPVWNWHYRRNWFLVQELRTWSVPYYRKDLITRGSWYEHWEHAHFLPRPGARRVWLTGACPTGVGASPSPCPLVNFSTITPGRKWHQFITRVNDANQTTNGLTGAVISTDPAIGDGRYGPTTAAGTWTWPGPTPCRRSNSRYDVGEGGACLNDSAAPDGWWHTAANWLFDDSVCVSANSAAVCGVNRFVSGPLWRPHYDTDTATDSYWSGWQLNHSTAGSSWSYANGSATPQYWSSCTAGTFNETMPVETSLMGGQSRIENITVTVQRFCTPDPNVYDYPRSGWQRSPFQYWGGNLTGPGGKHPNCANAANAAIPMSHCGEGVESSICPAEDPVFNTNNGITGHTARYENWCLQSFNAADGAFHHVAYETLTNAKNRESVDLPLFGNGLYAGRLLKETPNASGPGGVVETVPLNQPYLFYPVTGPNPALVATSEGLDTPALLDKGITKDPT